MNLYYKIFCKKATVPAFPEKNHPFFRDPENEIIHANHSTHDLGWSRHKKEGVLGVRRPLQEQRFWGQSRRVAR
jgi:hypothetical protein